MYLSFSRGYLVELRPGHQISDLSGYHEQVSNYGANIACAPCSIWRLVGEAACTRFNPLTNIRHGQLGLWS